MKTHLVALSIALGAPLVHAADALPNSADIAVDSDLAHMTLSVSQGTSGGCAGGFTFQGTWGGCVRESVDSQTESRACSDDTTGTQIRQRSRVRYSHQNGSVRHGAYGVWSGWTGTCQPAPEPTPPVDPAPDGPRVGTTYSVDAWICDKTNSNYGFPAGPGDSHRNKLISTYKGFNYYGRCPERLGYQFWIHQWTMTAQAYASQHGTSMNIAYDATFVLPGTGIRTRMLDSARQRGEHLASIIGTMDAECQRVADSTYGVGRIQAVYDTSGDGSHCRVTQVH